MADFLDHFATAIIALRDLALNVKIKPAEIKKFAKLERQVADSQAKLAVIEVQARELVARAERRLEAAAAAEQELALREQKIARLENAWRFIGEPADVMSGFRTAEYSPLQKARMAHGQPAGKDPDPFGFVQDAEPTAAIDALIRRDV